jgi:hypothetical protein
MTGEGTAPQEPVNAFSVQPPGATMIKEKKSAEKRSGTEWLGVVYMIVGIFVLIAAFQLYFTIQDLIRTWISDQFVPVVSALYYIAVIVGGVWLLRDYIRHQ